MEIKRCYDTLVGASVGENQLIHYPANGATYGGVTFTVNNNVIELSGTASSSWINCFGSHTTKTNHVYIIDTTKIADPNNINIRIGSLNSYINETIGNSKMYKPNGSVYDGLGIQSFGGSGTDLSGIKFSAKIIDLTDYFGSTIADYLYNLETATAGAGIAKLREWGFLRGYKAYNSGTIESVEVTGKKCVGFNQWNEVWETGVIYSSGSEGTDANSIRSANYNRCLPNTTYYGKSPSSCLICWYDGNKQIIGRSDATNKTATSPSSATYFRITCTSYGTTYNNDICINLSNPDRNGEYEPYTTISYPLGSDVLRGLFKLDANNNLYADGDRKTADGIITRRYGTRAYQEGDESLSDAITDGTITVYKLLTPTTETSTPFTSPQIVYPDGTEEFITENGVPVGHETKYQL